MKVVASVSGPVSKRAPQMMESNGDVVCANAGEVVVIDVRMARVMYGIFIPFVIVWVRMLCLYFGIR